MQSKIVFREMLSELKALADVQGNYLTKEDIKKFFPGDALNEEQFGLVCEYLVSQKIKVDGYEPAQKTPETAQKTVKEHAERASASNPETEKQEENSETQDGEGPDFLGMYLAELAEIEKLSETEEERLFFEAVNGDSMAKSTLAGQYLETVYELAMTYVASELPIEDLVQEGNIGLMKAVKRFDPEMGVRLVSYAIHWIKAEIHEYILRNWRMVKIATTKAQRKLFFNLRSHKNGMDAMTRAQISSLAEKLNVKDEEVVEMETRLNGHDIALETQQDDDDDNFAPIAYLSSEQTEPTRILEARQNDRMQSEGLLEALEKLDPRSRRIIEARWLNSDDGNGATLHDLAEEFGVSAERIRQIETAALKKMKNTLTAYS